MEPTRELPSWFVHAVHDHRARVGMHRRVVLGIRQAAGGAAARQPPPQAPSRTARPQRGETPQQSFDTGSCPYNETSVVQQQRLCGPAAASSRPTQPAPGKVRRHNKDWMPAVTYNIEKLVVHQRLCWPAAGATEPSGASQKVPCDLAVNQMLRHSWHSTKFTCPSGHECTAYSPSENCIRRLRQDDAGYQGDMAL